MGGKLHLWLVIFFVFIIALSGCGGSSGGGDGTANQEDTIVPSVPTDLTIVAVSESQIDLSWNVSTDNVGVAGYKLYRDGIYIKLITENTTADTGLSASLEYYCYTVSAYDEAENESEQSLEVCESNKPPTVEITSPVNNQTFTQYQGDIITFEGTAHDLEDGNLQGEFLVWTSSIDGQIGTGTLLTLDPLTEGQHAITLTATDFEGALGRSSVNITIQVIITWYRDADSDKYSDGNTIDSVERPSEEYYKESELTATSGDCDDNLFSFRPGAIDICEDGIDQDCDGADLTCFTIKGGDWYGSAKINGVVDARIHFHIFGDQLKLMSIDTDCLYSNPLDFYTITNYRFSIYESGQELGGYYSYSASGTFTNESTCTGTLRTYGGEWCEAEWEASVDE